MSADKTHCQHSDLDEKSECENDNTAAPCPSCSYEEREGGVKNTRDEANERIKKGAWEMFELPAKVEFAAKERGEVYTGALPNRFDLGH